MNLKLKRTPGLYLVGFTASGKSTVGRHLAGALGWSFFDIDEEIERAEQAAIAALLETRGEAEFRRIETRILGQHVQWIERGRPAVLALGAGAFAESANRALLSPNGITIWLDCPLEVIRRRAAESAERPLPPDAEKFAQLYAARREGYALADLRIAIESDDPAVTVGAILAEPALQ